MATKRRIGGKPTKTVDAIIETGKQSRRRRQIILFTVVFVIIALAISLGIYFIQVRPLQRTIIKVNDVEISIGYLIRRLEAIGSTDSFQMLQTLTDEELIRQAGPRYDIEITNEDIDDALHLVARGENESIADAEFEKWYRDGLNESQLSETEFRELWRNILIRGRIHEMEATRVSTVAEQIRLSYLLTESYEDALAAQIRLEAGEAFGEVANDVSIDTTVTENEGDRGWFPEAALPVGVQGVFGLAIGERSPPVALSDDGTLFGIFLVTDRAASREINEGNLNIIRAGAMDEWLIIEGSQNQITFHGMDWSETVGRYTFGAQTEAWIQWQLARRRSARPAGQ